jgi:predicted nucleotidyltransferase
VSTEQLEIAAAALGELREQVVFLGGATIDLWITDPAARAPRVTDDVDVVVEVVTLSAYAAFQAGLRDAGFHDDAISGVICRWQHTESGLTLDAIPVYPSLAGFGGQWLGPAAAACVTRSLPSGIAIRAVPPAHLLATKLEAFSDRGNNDCLASHDFEDIILLIDSREELSSEITAVGAEVKSYIRAELKRLTALSDFDYGVEGALAAPDARERARAVTIPRLQQLAT